jgi:hypothetical protein
MGFGGLRVGGMQRGERRANDRVSKSH